MSGEGRAQSKEVKVRVYDVSRHLSGPKNTWRWSSHIAREGGGCCESPTTNLCQPTQGVSRTTHVLQQVLNNNLATALALLYKLLQKGSKWHWHSKQKTAFKASKELLASSQFLMHFNPELKLILACDTSAYGIGAVLAHEMPDGTEKCHRVCFTNVVQVRKKLRAVLAHEMPDGTKKPITYALRMLSKSERNYSQLEKEGLSLVFGVKKFHSYLFIYAFELVTDHKPLLSLLSECKASSPQASACIKRWSLFLSSYEYVLEFWSTQLHGNADALSRLSLQRKRHHHLLVDHLSNSLITAQ